MALKNVKKKRSLYLRILSYLRPYYRQIFLVLFFNLGFVIFNTLSIWLVAPVVNALFDSDKPPGVSQTAENGYPSQQYEIKPEAPEKQPPPENQKKTGTFNLNEFLKSSVGALFQFGTRREMLKFLCLAIFLTFLLKNLFAFSEFFFVSYIEQKVIRDLRDEVYSHILKQPLRFFSSYKSGELISRITNDINTVNVAVNKGFTKIIRDPILIILFSVILFSINWKLTLVALTVVPLTTIVIRKIGSSLKRKSHRVQERISELTTLLQEVIYGIHVVKAFAMEAFEDKKFRNKTGQHFKSVVRQVRMVRLARPLSETLGVGVMVSVLWFGGNMALAGKSLTPEDFIRFFTILYAVMDPVKSLGNLHNDVQIALASGQRIFQLLDTPIGITEKADAVVKKEFERKITYDKVRFRYGDNGAPVLSGIDLEIPKNYKVAFVGGSGGGKTTLVNLLPRFYDVVNGAVKIDSIDVRDMTLNSLRHLMGIVTQEVILFNDTIANNIAYGIENYTLEDVKRAAKLANAYDFIMEMPEQFDALIGERGVLLSGGQRQRISIARAILKDPPILIFDEATSALDSESEHLIQEAIENLMKNRTVLMIAHRLSSIINSDKIVVLEAGKIVAEGTHGELLKTSQRYQQLYELQFAV